jgi:2-C-methyl-D-erythritol 4-phosphate cytidylyltransferase
VTSAIIVAAGQGARMGPGIDKLFLEVAGRPVVAHTWMRFDATPLIDEIVLVVREGMQSTWLDLATTLHPRKPFRLAPAGPERQDSVWNGLQALSPQSDLVAIQDGARPCTAQDLILATLEAARATGAAVAAQPVTDTLKESEDGKVVSRHLDRARLWAVQTPQCFRVTVIRHALAAVRQQGLQVTDDTAACALIGQSVKLVPSTQPNPKVTVPADLAYIELLLRESR